MHAVKPRMFFDKQLAVAVRKRMNGQTVLRQVYAERRISEYELACKLSRGKVPYRNEHWQSVAETARKELEAMAGKEYTGVREECLGVK